MRKVLYSPGFGAGWSSWNSGEKAKFMLEYQPLIDAIERGEGDAVRASVRASDEHANKCYRYGKDDRCELVEEVLTQMHPAVQQFVREAFAKFGDVPYIGGLDGLDVGTGEGLVRVEEYDGSESLRWKDADDDWI
jgi:hypothetical protein